MLARIVDMVARAQRSRAPIQRLADRVAGWFVPAVIAAALVAFAAWMMFGPEPRFTFGLVAAVTVLIIACPCALGLATPMSIMVGVGRGAHSGILIRDAEALERFERIDTIVLDKTGTLTEGKPKVVSIVTADGFDENELLRLAASVERGSEHPLAQAILKAASERELSLGEVSDFASPSGKGATGIVDGKSDRARQCDADGRTEHRHAGSRRRRRGRARKMAPPRSMSRSTAAPPASSPSPIRSKPSAKAALQALREDGLRIVMLTGDNLDHRARGGDARSASTRSRPACCRSARATWCSGCAARAAASPWSATASMTRRRWPPPMSASPWAAAPMSRSKAPASRCLTGDLMGLVRARRLSVATMRNIRQNLGFAFLYNAAGVPIAAGVLYPVFGILLSPMVGAAAMALSSVSVIGNALRLARTKLD